MIEVKNLYKSFGNLQILKGINIGINSSEIVSIVGASGTGKTTLLQIIGTLNKADKGEVWIHGKETTKMTESQIADFRNKEIGFVFQFHHLLAEFTAIENACIPAFIARKSKKLFKEIFEDILNEEVKYGDRIITKKQAWVYKIVTNSLNRVNNGKIDATDIKAFEVIRDSIGEKPKETLEHTITEPIKFEIIRKK